VLASNGSGTDTVVLDGDAATTF